MRIEDVIRSLNGMECEGVIEKYAIGGAVASMDDIQENLSREQRVRTRMQSIEASKSRMRRKLAARPVAEKLRMLDDLRARAITLRRKAGNASADTVPER